MSAAVRDDALKAKLFAVLQKQNPALAALCAAPGLTRAKADEALAQVYAFAPWTRDVLASLDEATRDRYAAALAQESGAGYEAVLSELANEAARACPF